MSGFEIAHTELNNAVLHFSVLRNGIPISVRHAFECMTINADFQTYLSQALIDSGFDAARFETPAATTTTIDQPFEFVLVDSPGLSRSADASSFSKQFDGSDPDLSVLVFPNLRGDATMIVPRPVGDSQTYTHLLDFLRSAPQPQSEALWKTVGETMLEQVNDTPRWLSTAGGGVPWLHVRIDDRPKYYSYQPYTVTT